MSLPVFTARPAPLTPFAGRQLGGMNLPKCAACVEAVYDVDDATGLCRACWRVVVLTPRGGALTYEPKPLPADARGPGIVGSHWIEPARAAAARPRSAVTSGEPPREHPVQVAGEKPHRSRP